MALRYFDGLPDEFRFNPYPTAVGSLATEDFGEVRVTLDFDPRASSTTAVFNVWVGNDPRSVEAKRLPLDVAQALAAGMARVVERAPREHRAAAIREALAIAADPTEHTRQPKLQALYARLDALRSGARPDDTPLPLP